MTIPRYQEALTSEDKAGNFYLVELRDDSFSPHIINNHYWVDYRQRYFVRFLYQAFSSRRESCPGNRKGASITFPLALYNAYRVLRYGNETSRLIPALGMNVIIVLTTDLLFVVGYMIG